MKFECYCKTDSELKKMQDETHKSKTGFNYEIGARLWYTPERKSSMLKQDKQESKRPYILEVEERYVRLIAVWGENVFEAREKAEELHGNGEINLEIDHYAGHEIRRSSVKLSDTIFASIPHYGKDD